MFLNSLSDYWNLVSVKNLYAVVIFYCSLFIVIADFGF